MKRAGVLVVVSIVLKLGVGVAEAAAPPLYRTCTNLNKPYAHGVGRVGARDKTSGEPVTNFCGSTRLYRVAMRAALAAPGTASSPRARNAQVTWSTVDRIFVANVEGTRRRKLAAWYSDCGVEDPSWTRDGRALAWVACISDAHRIEILRPATHGKISNSELASAGELSHEPAWSPDGKRIAVSEEYGVFCCAPYRGATIEIVTVAKNRWSSVTARKPNRYDSEPAWSPDGRTIAFTRQGRGGTFVYFVRPDGSGLRRFAKGHSPSWSPDGKRLAFVLAGSVYEIGADGRDRKRVVTGLHDALVRWSPDGRKLLYTSYTSSRVYAGRGPPEDLWTADVDGSHRRRILRHVYDLYGIAWRPRP